MKIRIKRLRNNLVHLSDIGCDPAGGITRISYSPSYSEAVAYVSKQMLQVGMSVWRDRIGNLFGMLCGKSDRTILMGSHIDTVPNGGMFDGSLGVMAGVEVIRTIVENGYQLGHNLMVAAFVDEEGGAILGTLGSKSFCGQNILDCVSDDRLKQYNLTTTDILASTGNLKQLEYYIELHIEQGGILEQAAVPLGIVQGIVGIFRYRLIVRGKANHAGCTPMKLRDDALRTSIGIIQRLYELAEAAGSGMVATVGQLNIKPGAPNVIPGEVEFIVELRSTDSESCHKLMFQLADGCCHNKVLIKKIMEEPPVKMSSEIINILKLSATRLGYSYLDIVSGAGHDAIPLAQITNAGMLFIPSIGGVSHCPEEKSEWDHVEMGTQVLLDTVLQLDKEGVDYTNAT